MRAVQRAMFRCRLRTSGAVPVVRLGSEHGGWFVPLETLSSESIVYSAGVGEDTSFDQALIARVGCSVWGFDPTPRAITHARAIEEPRFHFLPIGIWTEDSIQRFFVPADPAHVSHSIGNVQGTAAWFDAPCRSIPSLMRELGHGAVDLLKLDIEGAEYDVLEALVEPLPRIVCVELHPIRSVREMARFVAKLPYDVIKVDGWNVTLVRRVG